MAFEQESLQAPSRQPDARLLRGTHGGRKCWRTPATATRLVGAFKVVRISLSGSIQRGKNLGDREKGFSERGRARARKMREMIKSAKR